MADTALLPEPMPPVSPIVFIIRPDSVGLSAGPVVSDRLGRRKGNVRCRPDSSVGREYLFTFPLSLSLPHKGGGDKRWK